MDADLALAIERVLKQNNRPMDRDLLRARLALSGRLETESQLAGALSDLHRHGYVVEGSKGVQWVDEASPQIARIVREPRAGQ